MDHSLSSYRSLSILALYLLLAVTLTAHISRTLLKLKRTLSQDVWQRKRFSVAVFAGLAVLSLLATWYGMFSFFAYSYHDWACKTGHHESISIDSMEQWLRQTQLFKQAWEAVTETPQRFWWSGQIFLWTTGWSLFIGVMGKNMTIKHLSLLLVSKIVFISGRRYRIPHVWAYMLLGQIVAISFAQSLFYLAILLSLRRTTTQSAASEWTPSVVLELLPIVISLLTAVFVQHVVHSSHFLITLLIPHVLLFIPSLTTSPRIVPRSWGKPRGNYGATTSRYLDIFTWILGIAVVLHGIATYTALNDGSTIPSRRARWGCALESSQSSPAASAPWQRLLLNTVFEHPAVTSVGWDVIFCTVECLAWAGVNRFDARKMLGEGTLA
jgi:hypothetical protein